jgi:arylsulfatase
LADATIIDTRGLPVIVVGTGGTRCGGPPLSLWHDCKLGGYQSVDHAGPPVSHVMVGTAWWDQGINLVTRHAIRYVVVLTLIAGLTRWVMWRRSGRPDGDAESMRTAAFGIELTVWVRYVVIGLILGGTWVWQENEAPWTHAIRVAVLLVFVAPVIRWVRRRYRKGSARQLGGGVFVSGWIAAKLVLVMLALGLELLLEQWMSRNGAAEIVALCLGVTVAIAGPLLHERLVAGWRRPHPAAPQPATPKESTRDAPQTRSTTERRPNILVIMSDQHRADIMGCAGDPLIRTPHLDQLSNEGIRFDSAYCQGPLCMPARASLLTERYVRDHGVFQNRWDAPTGLPTFVQCIADAGYHTSCIGKMHLWVHGRGGADGKRTLDVRERMDQMRAYGFDEPIETVGKLATVNIASEYSDHLIERGLYDTYREWVAARMYAPQTIDGRRIERLPLWSTASNPVSGEDYTDTWVGNRVVKWIEAYDRPEPFFQWVGFPGPHDPWDAPEEYVDLYRNVPMPMPGSLVRPELADGGRFGAFLDYFVRAYSDSANLSDDVIAEVRRCYYGNLTLIDEAIGRILNTLERRGLLDETWVIYTSDHGEMMGEHRMLSKMVPYEPAVKVPLIIRPPGGRDPRIVTELVEHIDLSATIRDIAHSDGDPSFEGRSLRGWTQGTGFSRSAVFSESYGVGMVRTLSHKLVFVEDTHEPVQLFNLGADPTEDTNLVHDVSHRGVRDGLMATLVEPFLGGHPVRLGAGVLDRLEHARTPDAGGAT